MEHWDFSLSILHALFMCLLWARHSGDTSYAEQTGCELPWGCLCWTCVLSLGFCFLSGLLVGVTCAWAGGFSLGWQFNFWKPVWSLEFWSRLIIEVFIRVGERLGKPSRNTRTLRSSQQQGALGTSSQEGNGTHSASEPAAERKIDLKLRLPKQSGEQWEASFPGCDANTADCLRCPHFLLISDVLLLAMRSLKSLVMSSRHSHLR